VLDYVRRRFVFCGTPDEVESQLRAAIGAGARNFDGAIDAELPEHEQRITAWGRLVLPRFKEA
jgi:alkanesulfonate monooxygenase SsuD/methylene tetrahydromethanopterin reductase-like flavin-dependent oxidoreductase (luciferase family)